jgi:hypothetical protein
LDVLDVTSGEYQRYGDGDVRNVIGWLSDGSGVVYLSGEYGGDAYDLYQVEFPSGTVTRLTNFSSILSVPDQTPFPLCFVADQPTPTLYILDKAPSEPEAITTLATAVFYDTEFSPDYQYFAYTDTLDEDGIVVIDLQSGDIQRLPESKDVSQLAWIPCP